jgi:hypothetical protein
LSLSDEKFVGRGFNPNSPIQKSKVFIHVTVVFIRVGLPLPT